MKRTLLPLLIILLVGCDNRHVNNQPLQATFTDFEWRWDYAEQRIDLTHQAIFGSKNDFKTWAEKARPFFLNKFVSVPVLTPAVKPGGKIVTKPGYSIRNYVSVEGDSLLAVPNVIDPTKPIVIALHGHEIDHRGDAPWKLFDTWAGQFATEGYVVWAPSHLWYDRVGGKVHPKGSRVAEWDDDWHHRVGSVDYPIEWAKRVSVLLDSAMDTFPPHSRLAIVGLSAGGVDRKRTDGSARRHRHWGIRG